MINDPMTIFAAWYAEAAAKEKHDYTAMSLATATAAGKPSVRTVLLKAFDQMGFVFYTNFNSRKAQELLANPYAALCFFWQTIDKQVRIEGKVEVVSSAEADHYFASRARGSQIGAWASQQSQSLKDPLHLQQRVEKYTQQFEGHEVPRPDYWSGFRVVPERIEFWERGEYRLHQRTVYQRNERLEWEKTFLYP